MAQRRGGQICSRLPLPYFPDFSFSKINIPNIQPTLRKLSLSNVAAEAPNVKSQRGAISKGFLSLPEELRMKILLFVLQRQSEES